MPFSRGLPAVLHHLVPRRTYRMTRVYFVQSWVCFLTVVWGAERKKKKKKRLQGNLISSPSCWSLLLLLLLLLLLSTQYSCGSGSCWASMCTLARVCWRGTPAILMCEASTDLTFLVKESAVPLGPDCRGDTRVQQRDCAETGSHAAHTRQVLQRGFVRGPHVCSFIVSSAERGQLVRVAR